MGGGPIQHTTTWQGTAHLVESEIKGSERASLEGQLHGVSKPVQGKRASMQEVVWHRVSDPEWCEEGICMGKGREGGMRDWSYMMQ